MKDLPLIPKQVINLYIGRCFIDFVEYVELLVGVTGNTHYKNVNTKHPDLVLSSADTCNYGDSFTIDLYVEIATDF